MVQPENNKNMENKKIVVAGGLLLVILLIIGGVFAIFSLVINPKNQPPAPVNDPTSDVPLSVLPSADGQAQTVGSLTEAELALAKERQFISSFWVAPTVSYEAHAPNFDLPLTEIKDQAINFRDFFRKINITTALEPLSRQGFFIINSPFSGDTTWEQSYKLVRDAEVPIIITADSIAGLYQDTINVVYKEIEQDIFYPSLWELLKQLHDTARRRYEARFQEFGIETDLLTEANRLELLYLTVALELLKPEAGQIRESLTDQNFFMSTEATRFSFTPAPDLVKEVADEIELITKHNKQALSPVFLYSHNYEPYAIPKQYTTSEKLKNYYLTITWLNESLFPLWSQANDCTDCALDQQDHAINFVATLLLSDDLASNQDAKNQWANIYKSISFFRGLETNITYLDYARALKSVFGSDATLDELFTADTDVVAERIELLQKEINMLGFPIALGGSKEQKPQVGLRLLRNYYLLEHQLFKSLTTEQAGSYTGQFQNTSALPFTACSVQNNSAIQRCIPTGLDLLSLIGNTRATEILEATNNTAFTNYVKNSNAFSAELQRFDQNTWHDNAYMAALQSVRFLDNPDNGGWPSFMRTPAWRDKTLYTALATWVNQSKEINVEKVSLQDTSALGPLFAYGYIEPQPEFYAELLANVVMVQDGFRILQIINENTKSFERLDNLRIVLERVYNLSLKELANQPLTNDDYSFINNFNKHIRSFIGDIKKENVGNTHEVVYDFDSGKRLTETLDGFAYLVVLYPNTEGQPVLAIGPVFDYKETDGRIQISDWQKTFRQ